jgi:DHA1 family bicyclomycin/chloramphenicol resistance-like MFS transporter
VLQLVIGAVAAPLVGIGGAATAVPMAAASAAFGIATLIVALASFHPSPSPAKDIG